MTKNQGSYFPKHKLLILLAWSALVLSLEGVYFYYKSRILPGIRVGREYLGGKTLAEAKDLLDAKANIESSYVIEIIAGNNRVAKKISELGIKFDTKQTAIAAYEIVRKQPIHGLIAVIYRNGIDWSLTIDDLVLDQFIEQIAQIVDIPAIEPGLEVNTIKGVKTIKILPGSSGKEVNKQGLKQQILDIAEKGAGGEIKAHVVSIDPQLSIEELGNNQQRAENLVTSEIELSLEKQKWVLDGETLVSFVAFPAGFDEVKITQWILTLERVVNREPQNALFNFANGRVQAFKPGMDGIKLRNDELREAVVNRLLALADSAGTALIEIPVEKIPPTVSTDSVNSLGIKELVGIGKSKFHGSILNRIHNLTLASSRVSGALVAPGETFSFNQTVGDISRETGYKEAYVIDKGRTVLGDGGGVCQVSTTLFRAVLNTGLPVEERRAHAYRVHYYEENSKPGLDATVFAPSTDFKFKNDTTGYILIQANVDKKNYELTMELYGTKDGRIATISTPIIYSQTPPPPDLYQDDPSLPFGVIKQIDWKAWGARVAFDYKVEKDGQIIWEQKFVSNYKPWQAIYLKGTGGR